MDNLTLAIEILTRCEMEKKRLEEYEREYAEVEKAGKGSHGKSGTKYTTNTSPYRKRHRSTAA